MGTRRPAGRSILWAEPTAGAPIASRPRPPAFRAKAQTSNPATVLTDSAEFERLGAKRPAVLFGDERVGIDRLAFCDRNDDVHVAGPRPLGVEARSLGGVVGMAVVVAEDVEALGVRLALDADVVARIDLVAVARALDDDVPRPAHLRDDVLGLRSEHDPADLVGIALGAVPLDRLHGAPADLHLSP